MKKVLLFMSLFVAGNAIADNCSNYDTRDERTACRERQETRDYYRSEREGNTLSSDRRLQMEANQIQNNIRNSSMVPAEARPGYVMPGMR